MLIHSNSHQSFELNIIEQDITYWKKLSKLN